MQPHRRAWTLACLVLAGAAVALPGARAHYTEDEHGTFTVEYDDTGLTCDDVYIVGRHVDAPSGHYTVWITRDGSAPDERHSEGTFNATREETGDGYRFRIGPFNVGETGDADGYDLALTWHDGTRGHEVHVPFDGRCDGDQWVPACEDDAVTATANNDGSITLRWTQHAQTVEIHRNGEHVTTLNVTAPNSPKEWTDTDTEVGATYAYDLHFLFGTSHSGRGCLHVTAIPFITTPLLGAIALVGGVGAYVVMMRRR